jgi:hypothetical protein
MTVVHRSSNGISQAFPDVCKTPAPPSPSPIPIPYPNIAMSTDAADTASSVKADGNPIMVNTSKYAMSTGDEAGTLFGVMSNKIKGSANPQMWSMDVKADGKNVFRQLDIMLHNGGSKPINTPPGPNNQPPRPGIAKGQDPEKWKIVEVRWSDPKKKCGDMVKIRTKTEGYPNGVPIAHVIHKSGHKEIHAFTKGKVAGDAVDIDWITVNGKWEKNNKKLKVKAHGGKGVKESSGTLEIEVPGEVKVPVPPFVNSARLLQRVWVPVIGIPPLRAVYLPTGSQVSSIVGFDLEIKKGVFWIHHKIKIDPQPGVATGRRLERSKKKWRKEIEGVWNRKWKEHRVACARGDKCKCPGGCCLFTIHVKCSFVSGGEHKVVKLWPGKPKGAALATATNPEWWNDANWYERRSGREGNYAVVHAHEFGHNIGMEDEYAEGATLPAYRDVRGSIMQTGTKVMKQHWDSHPAGGAKSIHERFLDAVKDRGYKLLKV